MTENSPQSNPEKSLCDYALLYEALRWSVIPIEPGGKRPLIKWESYQQKRASATQIQNWWKQYPNANIGIVTGQISGIVAIDIDSEKGREEWAVLFGQLHATISQTSGKPGSMHLLFAHPEIKKIPNMARVVPDVDVRGDGGYIVAAPSIHPSGVSYKWSIDPTEMGLDDLLPLPPEVEKLLAPKPKEKVKQLENWVNDVLLGVEEGERNNICTRLAGYYLRIFSGDTQQTEALLQEWNLRNRPPLDWKEVRTVIESVAKREGRNIMSDAVGETIEKIEVLKYPPPDNTRRYRVFLTNHDGCVEMNTSDLVLFSRFKIKFTELANRIPRQVKQGIWENMVNKALAEADIIPISVDETLTGFVLRLLGGEAESASCSKDLRYVNSRIVINSDEIYVRMEVLVDMAASEREKVSRKEIGRVLRELGFKNERIKVPNGSRVRCWHRKYDSAWRETY